MNPTNQFLKKQGLKVCLPLLLLATACGEGTTSSSFQPDAATPSAQITAPSTGNSLTLGAPQAADNGLKPASVTLPPATDSSNSKPVLPPASLKTSPAVTSGGSSAKVPEPTALVGLAIAAAGMVVVKRKQQAA